MYILTLSDSQSILGVNSCNLMLGQKDKMKFARDDSEYHLHYYNSFKRKNIHRPPTIL